MKVAIVGTGYVGLVSGACLADKGHRVTCVDRDAAKLAPIRAGRAPFHEPGLDDLVARHTGRALEVSQDLARAVRESDITLIATGTPFDGERIDLAAVKHVAAEIGRALATTTRHHTVVVKSTVVPGTTDDVVRPILEHESRKRAGEDFGLGMNPEFLSEGDAVRDFMRPDRIVIGGIDARTIEAVDALYAAFPDAPRIRTSNRTAESIKYASNALLATLISFSNELAELCERAPGVDVLDVLRGVHLARELSHVDSNGERTLAKITSFLHPGCGYGGSCLPKDVKALVAHARERDVDLALLETVDRVNARQPARILDRIEHLAGSLAGARAAGAIAESRGASALSGVRVAVMGLAFKPGTDDMRESPAVPIIRGLAARGAHVSAFDPAAANEARKILDARTATVCDSMEQALSGARVVALVTRWEAFRDLPRTMDAMDPRPLFFDARRMLEKSSYAPYSGVGWRNGDARSS